jgi:hypothetical protein
LFILIRRSDSELVPMPPEVNVSFHDGRKRHERILP